MTTRFDPNPTFFKDLLEDDKTLDLVTDAAERVKEQASGLAPSDEDRYKDGLRVVSGLEEERGAVGRVIADDMASGFVEFGTVNNPAYAPLRRGAEIEVGEVVSDR